MADIFVDSNAVGSNDGTTWANAVATLVIADGTASAGDTIAIADNHTETNAANTTYAFADNVKLICSTVSGSTTITATTALNDQLITQVALDNTIIIKGVNLYIYGIHVSSSSSLSVDDSVTTENCKFTYNTGAVNAAAFNIIANNNSWTSINDEFISTANSSINAAAINIAQRTSCLMINPKITTTRARMFETGQGGGFTLVGGDASASTSTVLFENSNISSIVATGLVMPSTITDIALNDVAVGAVLTVEGCDNANTVNRQYRGLYQGELFSDTGIVLDSTNPASTVTSNKIVSNANAQEFFIPVRFSITKGWADFSTSKTINIEFCQDGTATDLTDAEIWIEVQYPDDTTSLYHQDSDRASDNQSAANQATSTASWTGLSGTNAKQKCLVTTTQTGKAGPYQVFVCLAKPSTTVYVNPKVDIS